MIINDSFNKDLHGVDRPFEINKYNEEWYIFSHYNVDNSLLSHTTTILKKRVIVLSYILLSVVISLILNWWNSFIN